MERILLWERDIPQFDEKIGQAAPSLTPFLLDDGKKHGAVIVFPGGGYCNRAPHEAGPIAERFNQMGFHAFVLQYRVAPYRYPAPQRDALRAVRLVRSRAAEWGIAPDRIATLGFSAGGHLACSLGVFWNREFLWKSLGKAPEQIRPSGMILGYPVISSGPFAHVGSFKRLLGDDALEGAREGADQPEQERFVSLETQVSPDTPKTFLWHTFADSSVPLENSLMLAEALRRNGVEFEMHIYPKGEHGLSLAAEETAGERREMLVPSVQSWIHLAKTWIEGFGNA